MNTNLDNTKEKDTELARWREQALQEDATANVLRDHVASLTSLVNELTVALSGSLDIIGNVAEYIEVDCGTMLRVETYREILANAREVCK